MAEGQGYDNPGNWGHIDILQRMKPPREMDIITFIIIFLKNLYIIKIKYFIFILLLLGLFLKTIVDDAQ